MYPKQGLSIGVNAYTPSYLTLRPCLDDARDVAGTLKSIGFHVQTGLDVSLKSMNSMTDQFIKSIQPGAVVVYYFSGHGVQYNGRNYLIATDAVGICADNIKSTAVDVQTLIDRMHARKPRLVICILDCCRSDPPTEPLDASPFRRALFGTRDGLAPMQAPPSTIVCFACAADDTASPNSRNGRNSLYTYHLLRYLRTPNVDIETLLKYVAIDVQKESKNKQIPYRYSSCNESIFLVGVPGYKILPPLPFIPQKHALHPLERHHRKAVPSQHHGHRRPHHYPHHMNDRTVMPMHPHFVSRNPYSNMFRAPEGYYPSFY